MKWTLQLTLKNDRGENYHTAIDIGHTISGSRPVFPLRPPSEYDFATFDTVVEILKARTLRKDVFGQECQRLGRKLAEHLEDKEGWHGEDRKEAANKEDKL